ncbi:MAG TPA: DUF1326 domain-containing protein [Casimicrobiaceae bacterium]
MAADWKLTGTYFETCNCEAVCPCNVMGSPTDGTCTVLAAWHIDHGTFGSTTLDGLNVGFVAHAPGNMFQTKWKVALYLDERATDAQRDALGQIYSGQAGGLMAKLGGFIGEVAGVRSVPIEYRSAGRTRSVRIGSVAAAEIEAITGGDGVSETLLVNPPINLAPGERLVVARSRQYRFADHGMLIEVSNKNGFYAPFTYTPA